MKKRKGFTLVELLAVIVILAIVALIAVPVMINILNKANKSAFKDSAYGLINAGELYFSQQELNLNGIEEEKIFEFPTTEIAIKGNVPDGTILKINPDGNIFLTMTNGRFCIKKEYEDNDITISEDLTDCGGSNEGTDNGGSDNTQNTLPKEYVQVDYIENSGTQYIDTGIIPNNNTGVDIIYQVPTEAAYDKKSQYILGSRDAKGTNRVIYAINGGSSSTEWDIRMDNGAIYSNVERTTDKWQTVISMENGGGNWYLTNLATGATNTITIPTKTINATAPLVLFGFNSTNVHGNLRIYSCKIYDGQTLEIDFVPCYRKSDNVAGMYDLVEGKFYTNEGTGTFIIPENS